MFADALEDIGEPGLWVDVVQFCRADQGVNDGGPVTTAIGACGGRSTVSVAFLARADLVV